MPKTTITFDGHDLTQSCICGDLVRQFIPRSVGTVTVPGMDGTLFAGVSADSIEITATLTVVNRNLATRSDVWRSLASILAVDTPRPLAISDDGGKYYMAVPHGGDVMRYINAESVEIGFTCPDPAMYGAEASVQVSSTATFTVGGNRPTLPTLTMPSIAGSSGYYTITLDGESVFSFECSSSGRRAAEADAASRTLTVGGEAVLPTLQSDWPVLSPGEHTVAITGTGACTLAWRERWF